MNKSDQDRLKRFDLWDPTWKGKDGKWRCAGCVSGFMKSTYVHSDPECPWFGVKPMRRRKLDRK